MKNILIMALAILVTLTTAGAQTKSDTVVIELAKSSKVVFTLKDKSDLPLLRQYDYQALFNDMLNKLEKDDTVIVLVKDSVITEKIVKADVLIDWDEDNDSKNYYDDDDDDDIQKKYRTGRTRHSFNFDFGTNNYLENGEFPDAIGAQYTVRPWGSWYIGLNSVLRTHVTGKFFVEWGAGISWYNFKFQDDATLIVEDIGDVPGVYDEGVYFVKDYREVDFVKSKLTVSYINVSLIPMFDAGGYNRKARFWNSNNSTFRIGAGPYAGYRIESHSKLVYKEDGDKEKDKESNNFYLNNFRYGVRLQVGVRSTDVFFNYDLNELFIAGKGPKLNAFSFGIIF